MANARDVWMMGEDTWLKAVSPLSYGLEPVRGWGFNDLRRPEGDDGRVWDWAGVAGRWYGSYAFVDYADWIALNEPRLIQLRRQMNNLDLSRYHEALGDLMHFDLVIDEPPATVGGSASSSRAHTPTPVEHDHFFSRSSRLSPPRSDDGEEALSTSLPTSDLLPPIYFHGRSAQQSGSLTYPAAAPMTSIRGVVRLTADDPPQVRWTVMIRYGGEDRWKLECVQLGGRGSKRGYVGVSVSGHGKKRVLIADMDRCGERGTHAERPGLVLEAVTSHRITGRSIAPGCKQCHDETMSAGQLL